MDWNRQTLEFLSQSFSDTVSPQAERRRRNSRLVAEPSVDEQIRECAAVNFMDHLKTRGVPSSAPDVEAEQIKTLLVSLILSVTPKIQGQNSEGLALIESHDLPKPWPDLLPELKSSLETAVNGNDMGSVNGILATLNYLFPILLDLKYWVDNFLLSTVERKINADSVATLEQLLVWLDVAPEDNADDE